jgi:drug/metabolite transporter (DMT)-like permease
MKSYVIIVLCTAALAVGQMLFKYTSTKIDQPVDLVLKLQPFILLTTAVAIYGISTIGWVIALRSVPLSRAYMFMAAGFIIVPVASYLLFDEPLTFRFCVGALMVALGIVVAVS